MEYTDNELEVWRENYHTKKRTEEIIATGKCKQVLKIIEKYLNYIEV